MFACIPPIQQAFLSPSNDKDNFALRFNFFSFILLLQAVITAEFYRKEKSFMIPNISLPDIPKMPIPDIHPPEFPDIEPLPIAYSYSDTQFEILQKYILEYSNSLDDEHEVALLLTNFGQSLLMHVTEISYENSVLMIFKGYVNGKMSTLIQHVSQLNFLLTSVEKEPSKPKRPIGFVAPK